MLQGLIVPNEPKRIRQLLPDLIEVPMGYDICLLTNLGKVGIERKRVPSDLISSIEDGRLGREILAMREECKVMVILFHGVMRYNANGTLKLGRGTSYRWTDKGIRNVRRTLEFVEGCYVECARNNEELVKVVNEVQEYLDKPRHDSMHIRQGIKSNWIRSTREEKIIYWMQGLPGVGISTARKLYEKFPTPLSIFQAVPEDISSIPRMGKTVAMGIYNFLRTGSTNLT